MVGDQDERGPFALLYERWFGADPSRKSATLEAELRATNRDAWKRDIGCDRVYVLTFLQHPFDLTNKDLLVEGLRSTNSRVAQVAAVTVSVACGLSDIGLEADSDIRSAFREMVRRFPENDGFRPQELYGHLPGDRDDSGQQPFVNLYEDWRADDYPGDPALRRRLAETYRDAWASCDSIERAFVLQFLDLTRPRGAKRVEGSELVIEGLLSEDQSLASCAAFIAWSLNHDGVDLGSDLRPSLEAHCARFPRVGPARWALMELDEASRR